jgi:hypothetical protein
VSRDDALPVLFLDIDDVLCLSSPYGGYDAIEAVNGRRSNPTAIYRKLFEPRAQDVLGRLHDTMDGQLRYVVSSTWRECLDREQMSEMFRKGGLAFVAGALHSAERWCTPCKFNRSRRVDEIAAWLDRHHTGQPFAILDDMLSGASLLPALTIPGHPFGGRVVLCRENVGLSDEHVQPLIDALGRPPAMPGQGRGVDH